MQIWWNPNYYRSAEARVTSYSVSVGLSRSCYQRYAVVQSGNRVTASYRIIPNCDCTCKATTVAQFERSLRLKVVSDYSRHLHRYPLNNCGREAGVFGRVHRRLSQGLWTEQSFG